MIINNKLDYALGSVGSFAGKIIFLVGVAMSFFDLTALILVLIGAFVGFTRSEAQIDSLNHRARMSNTLFGFLRTGKWITIADEMSLAQVARRTVNRTFSRSNRILDLPKGGFKIVLLDAQQRIVMPLFYAKTEEETQKMLKQLEEKLWVAG